MKKYLIGMMLIGILGCEKNNEQEVINIKQLKKIDGIFYKLEDADKYTGVIEEYNKENILIGKAKIKNGVLNGAVEGFYNDGTLKISQEYKGGVLNGKTISYTLKGTPLYEKNFNNGDAQGPYKLYYLDGQLKFEQNFSENIVEGEVISYRLDGTIENKKIYKDGQLISEKSFDLEKNNKYIFSIHENQSIVTKKKVKKLD